MKSILPRSAAIFSALFLSLTACQKTTKVETSVVVEKPAPSLSPGVWVGDANTDLPSISLNVSPDNRLMVVMPNSSTSGRFVIDSSKEPAVLTFTPDDAPASVFTSQIHWIDTKTVTMTYPAEQGLPAAGEMKDITVTFRQQ